jgi:hypothetical protein
MLKGPQPPIWTNIEFEVADDEADALASALSAALDRPGWYADFRSAEWIYIVFPGRVFRYLRGNGAGQAQAQATSLGPRALP